MNRRIATDLPPPSPDALAVSAELSRRIAAAIAEAGGRIRFEQFMSLALYAPGLGYYSAGAAKLGAAGDFVTAPEISPLFGRCLAHQLADILAEKSHAAILEFGAGSGRLAVDLLSELQGLQRLPERYLILEVSADLRARQQALLRQRLPELFERIAWLDALPEDFSGVVLANEVLDAMPVVRFRKSAAAHFVEMGVQNLEQGFGWTEIEAEPELSERLAAIESECGALPAGYTSEINPRLDAWFSGLAAAMSRGAVFIIDYGYAHREFYHPQRQDGTLLCHYRHRVHADPFLWIGLQDITASVDFTAAAEAAHAAGFEVAGYTSQAQFLLALGITERMSEAIEIDPAHTLHYSQQVKQLTLPGEMGERFKVLALTRGIDTNLRGFSLANQVNRL